jgi:hypothetical protein
VKRTNLRLLFALLAVAVIAAAALSALLEDRVAAEGAAAPAAPDQVEAQQGTAFTYQGRLNKDGSPVNATCEFEFTVWDALTGGAQQGPTLPVAGVEVENGLFAVVLDFEDQFTGQSRWLQTVVLCPGDATSTTLKPRWLLSSSPYAMSLRPGASVIGSVPGGGAALLGRNDDTTRNTKGVWGRADAPYAAGVYGSSGEGSGVWGVSTSGYGVGGTSTSSFGVVGSTSNGGAGVYGRNTSTLDFVSGVTGIADGGAQIGVYGSSTAGTAVRGDSDTGYGVVGISTAGKSAVYGRNDNTTPWSVGVWGRADAAGVFGVYGSSAEGTGVRGESTNGVAVVGNVTSASAYAAYFSGGRGVSSNVVEIRGGSDLAERFNVAAGETPEPGTLLVIDPANPGHLTPSSQPYDTRVAGVVSGAGGVNAGLTLHQEGVIEGDTVVAIAGRVYVKAEALSAPIQPGDLLTTSALPGHAMAAVDREQAYGAVIGKAMTGLEEGTGLVLVLVNLQ